MITLIIFLAVIFAVESKTIMSKQDSAAFILVPHGMSPESAEKLVIQAVPDGRQAPFPCLVAGMGVFEHGQTFTREHFHYRCNNGTSEVIACVADDKSVIHIGRMFIRDGIRHRCNVNGEMVTYEQESTCFDNGIHYDVGDRFRNGSFLLVCQKDGITIEGCYAINSDLTVPVGSQKIIDHHLHKCELLDGGRVRYSANVFGCRQNEEFFNEGQVWTKNHIRYQCAPDGMVRILGCVDETGLFVELGRSILMKGMVHQCSRGEHSTAYQRFACNLQSLTECLTIASSTPN